MPVSCFIFSFSLPNVLSVNMAVGLLGLFYEYGLNSIRAGLSNHMPSKVWDEIIYPFPNFNGAVDEFTYLFPDFILRWSMGMDK